MNECTEVMLTTIDNPYNPFEEFTQWFLFDEEKGYHSCAYLARIAKTSSQFSDKENDLEIERAIDEIVKYDFMNLYKKVRRADFKNKNKGDESLPTTEKIN